MTDCLNTIKEYIFLCHFNYALTHEVIIMMVCYAYKEKTSFLTHEAIHYKAIVLQIVLIRLRKLIFPSSLTRHVTIIIVIIMMVRFTKQKENSLSSLMRPYHFTPCARY
jgi:hypothetical protein